MITPECTVVVVSEQATGNWHGAIRFPEHRAPWPFGGKRDDSIDCVRHEVPTRMRLVFFLSD